MRARLRPDTQAEPVAYTAPVRQPPARSATDVLQTEQADIAGHIDSLPVPDLFELLATRQMTGILRIDAQDTTYFGWLLAGNVAWLMALGSAGSVGRTSGSAISLVPVPSGRASPEEFRTVLRLVESWLGATATTDRHREYILLDEVVGVLLSAISLREGAFSFQGVGLSADGTTVIDTRAALLEAYRRFDEMRRRA